MSLKSVRNLEGYLLIDHSNSPGLPDDVVVKSGLQPGMGRGFVESATYTCKHCQAIIVLGSSREVVPMFCRGCQHMICDNCATEKHRTGICRTFDQVIDEALASLITSKEY